MPWTTTDVYEKHTSVIRKASNHTTYITIHLTAHSCLPRLHFLSFLVSSMWFSVFFGFFGVYTYRYKIYKIECVFNSQYSLLCQGQNQRYESDEGKISGRFSDLISVQTLISFENL